MSKTKFGLTIYADTLAGAEALVEEQIASFLGMSSDDIHDSIDVEFVVTTPDPEVKDRPSGAFEVTVYASLKRNAVVNFGIHSK